MSVFKPKLANQQGHSTSSEPIKTWSKQIQAFGAKRGKTCASASRLVLVLLLIGWQSGASHEANANANYLRHSSENYFVMIFYFYYYFFFRDSGRGDTACVASVEGGIRLPKVRLYSPQRRKALRGQSVSKKAFIQNTRQQTLPRARD